MWLPTNTCMATVLLTFSKPQITEKLGRKSPLEFLLMNTAEYCAKTLTNLAFCMLEPKEGFMFPSTMGILGKK